MLRPQTNLGSHSSYSGATPTSNGPVPLGGTLRLLSEQVSQLNAQNAPLDLTFGVEIEFTLLGKMPEIESPGGFNYVYPAQITVYNALREPVRAKCATCGAAHWLKLPVISPDDIAGSFDVHKWSIDRDASVTLTAEESNIFLRDGLCDGSRKQWGLELKSRVFMKGKNLPTTDSLIDSTHRHEITIEQEITLMLETLQKSFNGTNGIHLTVNSSCGLHVHVGNGITSQGFPLPTVKGIFSLYTASERAIDSIMSTDRISGSKYSIMPLDAYPGSLYGSLPGANAYNLPNSGFFIDNAFVLLHYRSQGHPHETAPQYPFRELEKPEMSRSAYSFEPSDWLSLIQNAASLKDLRDLHRGLEHHNALNFENLETWNGQKTGKVTVEFRQHAGTVEPVEVIAWADFVTTMVKFSHESTPAQLRRHIDTVLVDPNFDTLKLLKAFGCTGGTIAHYRHVLGQAGEPDYAATRRMWQSYSADQVQDGTSSLRHTVLDSRAAALSSAAVQDRVSVKFKLGGYGRYSEAYLDRFEPKLSVADKKRLTAGTAITCVPNIDEIIGRTQDSSQDNNEDERWDPADLALTPSSTPSLTPDTPILQPAEYGFQSNHPSDRQVNQEPATGPRSLSLPTDFISLSMDQQQDQTPPGPEPGPLIPSIGDDLPADLPEMLPPPLVALPIIPSRPESVMRRRRIFVPHIDLSAAERLTRRIRARREAVAGSLGS